MEIGKYFNPFYQENKVTFSVTINFNPAGIWKWKAKVIPNHKPEDAPSLDQRKYLMRNVDLGPVSDFEWFLHINILYQCWKYRRHWNKIRKNEGKGRQYQI